MRLLRGQARSTGWIGAILVACCWMLAPSPNPAAVSTSPMPVPFTSSTISVPATWTLEFAVPEMALTPAQASFNPSILPVHLPDSSNLEHTPPKAFWIFWRISNMNFCAPNVHWRQVLQREQRVRSFVAVGQIKPSSNSTELAVVKGVLLPLGQGAQCTSGFDLGDGQLGSFGGAEDPRPIDGVHQQQAPWLLVSVWSNGCSRLQMHLSKLAFTSSNELTVDVSLPLQVRNWDQMERIVPNPNSEPIQKNWVPFVHRAQLLVEYSIEPRIVLHVDPATGACTPQTQLPSSFPSLVELTKRYGRVSGGAAAVLLTDPNVYLGLAHVKDAKQTPELLGSNRMVYRHLFYAFEAKPPFKVIAAGQPFVFNTSHGGDKPTVQFSSGMTLDAGGKLLVSFSELDCGGHLAKFDLRDVLIALALKPANSKVTG